MKTIFIVAALLLVMPSLLLAAPQPYVPQPGDLSGKDQPSAATVRQVQNRAENFTPMPHRPSNTPVRPPQQQRFQPRPYIPDQAEIDMVTKPTTPTPTQTTNAQPGSNQPGTTQTSTPGTTQPVTTPTTPGDNGDKPAPVVTQPVTAGDAKAELTSVMNKALAAFTAHDCSGLLKFFHAQAYVLVRNPWGEQGSLGHQQLREAHCADVSSAKAPVLTLNSSQIEILSADRGKVWGKMTAKWEHQGQPVQMPASFEADLVKENGQWFITDAIIQYDMP